MSAELYKVRTALESKGLSFATASAADIALASAIAVGPAKALKSAASLVVSKTKAVVNPELALQTKSIRLPICKVCPDYQQTGGGHMCNVCLCVGPNFDARLSNPKLHCPKGNF